jgi:hypothetical protein
MEGSVLFSNQSFFTSIAGFCEDSGRGLFCLATFLALRITDAIAQASNNDSWPEYFSDAEQSNNAVQDAILYTRYYYTYAHRFDSSRGIPLSCS